MVNDLGARYNRSVWVTELDCPNAGGPVEHELAFMRNVTDVRCFPLVTPCARPAWGGPVFLRYTTQAPCLAKSRSCYAEAMRCFIAPPNCT